MFVKERSCILPILTGSVIILLFATAGIIVVLLYSSLTGIKWDTKNGEIQGTVMYDRDGGTFYAFQSIPYAKPPIDERRFKAPEAAGPWNGVLDATKDIPGCPQHDVDTREPLGVEDCLYLNVYTPHLPSKRINSELKHVMVYIHGGQFIEGSATINKYGPQYLITQDIVLVVMNYRLGVLGFVNLDDSEIFSNNGLRDQHLALQWVKDNIDDYGGNPNNITLFGHSAGAISAHFHMLAPISKGLFHRVIIQSGSATTTVATGKRNTAILLGQKLDIQTENITDLIHRLREMPEGKILEAQKDLNWESNNHEDWPGGIVIEGNSPGAIVPQDAHEVLNLATFEKLPLLIGITNKEGLSTEVLHAARGITDFDISLTIPKDLNKNCSSIIADNMQQFYFANNDNLTEVSEGHIRLWGDLMMKYYTVTSARKHAEYGPVYFYEFSADTKLNYIKKANPVSSRRSGVGHADELAYIYKGLDWFTNIEPESIEDLVSRRMVKMWTNFAKYGKPVVETDTLLDVNWQAADQYSLNYMEIGEKLTSGVYHDASITFWDSIYEKYGGSNKI